MSLYNAGATVTFGSISSLKWISMSSDKASVSAGPLRVGIAGLGVGGEVARQLCHRVIARGCGRRDLVLTVVSARSRIPNVD